MGKALHDYPAIRKDYVEGILQPDGSTQWPTMEVVAKKWRCGASALRDRAAAEDWVGLKNKYQTKVDETRREKKATAIAQKAADFDGKVLTVAEAQLSMIVAKMSKLNTASQGSRAKGVDSSELGKLARALRDVQIIGRLAMGQTPDGSINGRGTMRIEWVNGAPTDDNFD